MYKNIYEEKSNQLITKNVKDVLKNIENYQDKLKKYAEKFDYEIEYLQQIIWENEFLINQISKSPSRQNFHENIVEEYIKNNFIDFENFMILPKRGIESIYLSNGIILSSEQLVTSIHTKSIDFYWEYRGYKIYATHKYTKEAGGSQDNQYKDVIFFLEHAKSNIDKKSLFLAICDGEYYSNNNFEKINKLKSIVLNTKCLVATVTTIKDVLDEYINSVL